MIQHTASASVTKWRIKKTPVFVHAYSCTALCPFRYPDSSPSSCVLLYYSFFSYRRAYSFDSTNDLCICDKWRIKKTPILLKPRDRLSFIPRSFISIFTFFLSPCLLYICNMWHLHLWQMKDKKERLFFHNIVAVRYQAGSFSCCVLLYRFFLFLFSLCLLFRSNTDDITDHSSCHHSSAFLHMSSANWRPRPLILVKAKTALRSYFCRQWVE